MPLDRETYPGLYNALATPDTALELDDVADDVAAEQETLTSGSPEVPANSSASAGITDGLSSLQETLKHVSKGILDSTESEYKRLISNCDTFLKERGLLQDGESLFSRPPRREAAYLIVVWIMDACDSVKLDGTNKPSTDERGLYGHAQKMRAAMTYAFGHLQGLGNLPWHESELHSGQMLGNPSVSVEVSSYMCSLRRRKVQAGKVAVSACAITSVSTVFPSAAAPLIIAGPQCILERMYHFNHRPENWAILDYQPGGRGDGSINGSDNYQRLIMWLFVGNRFVEFSKQNTSD
ncbi:hypothetical protein BD769DRAFT_1660470 [Suillus cothurnatus]|nr:hypothetical protein BD769DRAFT_1660470 [Suillus cothurnatus]